VEQFLTDGENQDLDDSCTDGKENELADLDEILFLAYCCSFIGFHYFFLMPAQFPTLCLSIPPFIARSRTLLRMYSRYC
jgi:hypothetical protein